jgi:hypothetical protein
MGERKLGMGVDGHVLLTQQSSITVYCLPTKENRLLFDVSICSKQT